MFSPKFYIGSIYNETDDEEYASSKDGTNPMQNPFVNGELITVFESCLLYTSPSPRDGLLSRMPSSA